MRETLGDSHLRFGGRNRELHRALINWMMVGIHQLDQDLVRPRRKALKNDWVSTSICPVPCGVIDCHMNVPDAGRDGKRSRPEHRHDVQILRAILNDYPAMR